MALVKGYLFRRVPSSVIPGHWTEVFEAGDGPTILFVHGATGSPHNFQFQFDSLSDDYRCVAVALRGHGGSPWPGPSHIDEFYQDLEDVVATLPPRFAVLGHSFGGYLAARLAANHPERVVALGLLNTAGNIPKGVFFRLLRFFSPKTSWAARLFPRMMTQNDQASQNLAKKTLDDWDCWEAYPRIQIPSLVVLGRLDPLIPARLVRQTADLLPEAQLQTSLGGHFTMLERPEVVTEWIRELLRRAEDFET